MRLEAPDEIVRKYWRFRAIGSILVLAVFAGSMTVSHYAIKITELALIPALLFVTAALELARLVHLPARQIEERYARFDDEIVTVN